MIRMLMLMLPKVNRAAPQSVFGDGFYPDKRDSKLCFEDLKTFSVPENNLPLAGEKRFRSQRFLKPFLNIIGLQHHMFH